MSLREEKRRIGSDKGLGSAAQAITEERQDFGICRASMAPLPGRQLQPLQR
jgi:hypothetical protein